MVEGTKYRARPMYGNSARVRVCIERQCESTMWPATRESGAESVFAPAIIVIVMIIIIIAGAGRYIGTRTAIPF